METKTELWSRFYSRLDIVDVNNPTSNFVVNKAMSTSRYAERAAVIAELLKDGDTILEIGCGYGGLAAEIMKLVDVSYTVVDNAEMLVQARRMHKTGISYIDARDVESLKKKKFTLFISHFCLSETPKVYREYVLKNIIKNCLNISVFDYEDSYEPTAAVLALGLEVKPIVIEKYINKFFTVDKIPDKYGYDRFHYIGKLKIVPLETICFVTRCHPQRPRMLRICKDSVEAQTCKDYTHFLFRDDKTETGYGRAKADVRLKQAKPLNGRYVMVLDDDDLLIDDNFVADFKEAVDEADPDIVIFKGRIGHLGILPVDTDWEKPPRQGAIGSFCFAVRKELWDKYIKAWGKDLGDFAFINKCYSNTDKVLWMDKLVAATQRISNGEGEPEAKE